MAVKSFVKKVGQKATSFGFALERATDSIPNFPAAVNIFNGKEEYNARKMDGAAHRADAQ